MMDLKETKSILLLLFIILADLLVLNKFYVLINRTTNLPEMVITLPGLILSNTEIFVT